MSATCSTVAVTGQARPLREGDRVVVYGKFEFYPARGSLSLRISELHPVGLGELLARLQRIRELLAAEGLTAAERKRPLPFLPKVVGLITGRASAAESDVLANARARWPTVAFRIRNVAVQGTGAVTQIMDALAELDADPDVEVIVLARGGGIGRRPAAVLRRDAVPGGVRVPHARGVCGRPRTGSPDRRRRRRRTLLHPHRRGQANRPGRRRRAPDRRSAAQPRPPQPDALGGHRAAPVGRHPGPLRAGRPAAPDRPARRPAGRPAPPQSEHDRAAAGQRVGSTSRTAVLNCSPSARRPPCRAGTPSCRPAARCCATPRRRPPAPRCGSGSPPVCCGPPATAPTFGPEE